VIKHKLSKSWIRNFRGWLYRQLPSWGTALHRKRVTGYERRWGLEQEGFCKEGFFRVFRENFLKGGKGGTFLELRAGDGLVGSLGVWLESLGGTWKVESWEDRPDPLRQLRIRRPGTKIVAARLTDWGKGKEAAIPDGISTRGVREASAICRAVRKKSSRPRWIVIWNPSRRPIWAQRLQAKRYRLELAWHNLEFYRRSQP
jgi:hypothetical protein